MTELLGHARLLTLHGPGGVGKTRLALEVAAQIGSRYRDGVRFCDLAAIRGPATVTRAIANATGLSERAFLRLDDQLVKDLARCQVLLVLDNCEHVANVVAIIADRLLRETRNVTILATSRERLGIDGEHVWPVRPLAADGPGAPAVRLFLDRARAATPVAGTRRGMPSRPRPYAPGWTACRSRSSSPPRGCPAPRSPSWPGTWTTGSAC